MGLDPEKTCNTHDDYDTDTNLCDGQKCISNDLCESQCCLGIADDGKGICFDTSDRPCEPLANGESCDNGNECNSGHCLAGSCRAKTLFWEVWITLTVLVVLILAIVAIVCVRRYRKKERLAR